MWILFADVLESTIKIDRPQSSFITASLHTCKMVCGYTFAFRFSLIYIFKLQVITEST